MLSPVKERDDKVKDVQQEIYLNFNHRPQRIIIYNLTIFFWSISNILFYSDMVSDSPSTPSMYSDTTNNLLLIYHLMLSIASFIILFLFYYRLKIKDINAVNISFSIAGNNVQLPLIDGINLFVGFIYFLSFLFHFAITWKMCDDICGDLDKPSGCNITIISSTLYAIVLPLIFAADIFDNFLRNPNKRILIICLFTFLSTFVYIFEFQSNDFGENTYYLSSYIRFSQTSFYLVSAATAIIYICEGFYHEGVLKKYFEIIVSFVLLCSPIVAFGCNVIELNGKTISHETWFIIVVLSIFMSYDLQRLEDFNINVIGAQSTVRERLITAPEPDYGGINTPSFMKKPKEKQQYVAPNGSINPVDNDDGDHLVYGGNYADDFEDDPDENNDDETDNDKEGSLSFLVFKQFSFKLDDKKQRLLIFNTLLLIYSVGRFIYFFNFWVNYDKSSFNTLKTRHPKDFSMHLKKGTYQVYCTGFVLMIILSVAVIFMEWFIVETQKQTEYKLYRYSCGILYVICGLLQVISVIYGANDYCKHLDSSPLINNGNGNNTYCHLQYVGTEFLSIMLPLFILSIDIIGFSKLLFNNTRIRVEIFHLIISLTALLFYAGYYNYYTVIPNYTKTKLFGLLMVTFSFIFSTFLSPLFIYLQSNAFSNLANFISTVLIIVGLAFFLDVNDLNINIADWMLFLPISCLVAYEIQLL